MRNFLIASMAFTCGCSIYSESFRRDLVVDRAAFDLACSDVYVTKLGDGSTYGAAGCGRRATYIIECTGGMGRRDLCDAKVESMNGAPARSVGAQ